MSVKKEALSVLDTLSETTTWDDIMYAFYVRQKVAMGLSDIREENTVSQEEAIKRLVSNAY